MIAPKDYEDDLIEQYRVEGIPQGLKIDCCLDKYWSHVPGQLTVVASHANVGKTTFFLWYFFVLMKKYGLKFDIYSSENSVWSIKKNLYQLYHQKKLEDMTENELYQAQSYIRHHVDFISPELFYKEKKRVMTYKDILGITKDTESDIIFIDPWTSLGFEGNQYQHNEDAVNAMNLFCSVTGKNIYLSTHGKTEALMRTWNKEHDFAGHTKPLLPADVVGGGKFINNVHNQFFLHRYTKHSTLWGVTEVHINKFKENERGGRQTPSDEPVLCRLVNGIYFEFLNNGVKENPLTGNIDTSTSLVPDQSFDSQTDNEMPF